MNMHKLVRVLASAGIAATVVTSAHVASGDDGMNTVEAAESKNSNYKYQGDTGYGDGNFLLNDALIKTLEEDGELAFNGHAIEASEADYEDRAEKKSEFVEEHDQKFTLRGGTATKVVFPIQEETLSIDEVTEAYGDDYEVKKDKDDKYETYVYKLGDQKDEAEKNVIAFKVENDFVTQGTIGYSSSY
jgi:hypothetical protein